MTVTYDRAAHRFNARRKEDPEECTFDPHQEPNGEKYDFEHITQCTNFYRDNWNRNYQPESMKKPPLFVMSLTHNPRGELKKQNKDTYNELIRDGLYPYFGVWIDTKGDIHITYVDTSFASFSRNDAVQAFRNGQEAICIITSKGGHDFPEDEEELNEALEVIP